MSASAQRETENKICRSAGAGDRRSPDIEAPFAAIKSAARAPLWREGRTHGRKWLSMRLDVGDDILDGLDLLRVFVGDLHLIFLFQRHH